MVICEYERNIKKISGNVYERTVKEKEKLFRMHFI